MRKSNKLLLAGAAGVLLAGAAIAAAREHVMTVALPDGAVAHISYQGDVAPKVRLEQARPGRIDFVPVATADPFAAMQREFAAMDADFAAMMRQAATMQQRAAQMDALDASGTPHMVAFGRVPKGAVVHYSYVSTSSNGGCTTRVEYSSDGTSGAQPRMLKTSSGDCGGAVEAKPAQPLMTSAPKPAVAEGAHRI